MGTHFLHTSDSISASVKVQSKRSTSRLCLFWSVKTLQHLLTILHHHCSHHQLPGPIITWENPFQVQTLPTRHMPECVLGVENQERKECFKQQSNQHYEK